MPDADIRPPREWLLGKRIGAASIRPIVTHGPSAMHPCQADVRTRIGSMSQTEIARVPSAVASIPALLLLGE